MLQQTQVSVVIGYFSRFMVALPDVHALAQAEEPLVLSLWAGLGYYSRARNLHRAARFAVETYGGLPPDVDGWRKMPGVGRYTLGAVRSIAYGDALPVVDGNVLRVLARVLGLFDVRRGNPSDEKRVWDEATRLIAQHAPAQRVGDYNQALMELGATLCSVSAPQCLLCPLRSCCVATRREPEAVPLPKRAAARKAIRLHAALVERAGAIVVTQRPARGLFAGMQALPSVERSAGRETKASRSEVARALEATVTGLGLSACEWRGELVRVSRSLTHRDVEVVVHAVAAEGRLTAGAWVDRHSAGAAMPAAFAAALDAALSGSNGD